MFQTSFIPQGWECPKCKRIYSPQTMMCIACPQYTNSLGTTTTSTTAMFHQFEFESSDKKHTSNSKCKICGKEKWEHPVISYT